MPQAAPTRTDLRRERTRRKLIDTGRALIAERGVAGLRIQEITGRADVALGSFYNHFATKDDLVEAVVSESLSLLASTAVPDPEVDIDPAEVVVGAIIRFMRLADVDPEFARLLVHLNHADALFAAAVHPYARVALERGIESGRFYVPDIEVTLTAVVGASFALIREILEGQKQSTVDRPFAIHTLLSLGLTVDDAIAVWDRAAVGVLS
jgi:AcrR family transcriptional regulator